jgi:pimeloyl-ACP methyl ester carboxylesterase
MKHYLITFGLLILMCGTASAACKDNVVLVHGNAASPASWNNTLNELYTRGYVNSQIFLPNWGSKSCATCNNHNGSEETPVRNAIVNAINSSCTGKIDIIGHSMGVTLAAQQIDKLAAASYVDTFVGVAGALLGLRSCGIYPYNVWNSTCGSSGLSISSPFLDGIYGVPLSDKVYSIKSFIDQVVCSTGSCYVYGIHSSRIWNEDATYTYTLGHFGLQTDTAVDQVNLIQ